MRLRVFLLLILSLCTARFSLRAQAPNFIQLGAFQAFRQTSATAQRFSGTGFTAQVLYTRPVSPDLVVQLTAPDGTSYPLTRQPDGLFSLRRLFASAAELAGAFPDGNYTISVSEGSSPYETSFRVVFGALPNPVLITNFDALQAWPTSTPSLSYQPIAGAVLGDKVELVIRRGSSLLVDTYTGANSSPITLTDPLPFSSTLQGELNYYHVAPPPALGVVVLNGFEIDFPLRCVALAPTIVQQPHSAVVLLGTTYTLQANAIGTGQQAFQYQLKKDGVPILAPSTRGNFEVAIRQPSDAGAYTIDVSYGNAVSTTNPAYFVVPPSLDFTPFAGSGIAGGKDGSALSAEFDEPAALAFDRAGTLYVADYAACTIRTISPSGVVGTLAGLAGQPGSVDGIGSAARFDQPAALAVDDAGNVYVADYRGSTIRKITPAGVVSTFAGDKTQSGATDGRGPGARFFGPAGLAFDPAGNLYVSDSRNHMIRKIAPDGTVTTVAGQPFRTGLVDGTGADVQFVQPGLCKFADGNLYVCDTSSIRRVSPAGVVTTLRGLSVDTGDGNNTPPFPVSISTTDLAIDSTGTIYEASGVVRRRTIGGVVVTVGRVQAHALALDPSGAIIAADRNNHVIRRGTLRAGSTESHLELLASPRSASMPAGANVVLSVAAAGPGVSYQWQKNGVGLFGETHSALFLPAITAGDQGTYSVLVGNGIGVLHPQPAPAQLAVTPASATSRLTNLSVRAAAGSGDEALIAGLVVGGGAPASTSPVLVRGVGPGLAPFGVPDVLADPTLTFTSSSGAVLASNDDWGGATSLADTFTATGAFSLAAGSRDAALVASVSNGPQSIRLAGKNDATGTALLEVYDATRGPPAPLAPRFVNLSARTRVDAGRDALVAGFVLSGAAGKTLLVRGVGPTLERYGVSGFLYDPILRIYDSAGTLVATNDNGLYGTDPYTTAVNRFSQQVGAFPLTSGLDSALLVTLPPGAYTAELSDTIRSGGIGLIELYEVP